MDEIEKNKALLGTIQSTAKGGYQPKIGHLLMPLPLGAKIWVFCTGCAQYLAIKSDMTELEQEFSLKFPDNAVMKEFFLQSPTCPFCKAKTDGKKIELKKIADLTEATQNE